MTQRLLECSGKYAKHMLNAEEFIKKSPAKIYNEYKDFSDKMRNESTKMR
jgi:hypothetical protein